MKKTKGVIRFCYYKKEPQGYEPAVRGELKIEV